MRKLLKAAVALACVLAGRAAAADLEVIGAGASFPAPAIEAWAAQYSKIAKLSLEYRSVGSGEGIRRVTARAADFGMTDVPLTQAELLQDDLMQFPLLVGAIVPVVNLPGVSDGQLRLSGPLLADIYLGRISRWNDAALKALNPHLDLPDLPIRVVHRADGSGTSFVYTYYLSSVSPAWQEQLGIGSRLLWPAGIGAEGNEGVALAVHGTAGAIGYVEYTYAVAHQLVGVQLRNRAGRFVRAGEAGARAALAAANWQRPGYYEVLVDREGAETWPIVGVSFVLVHKRQDDPDSALAVLNFLHWAYAMGAEPARKLHYVPLEDAALIGRIESSWNQIHDDQDRVLWTGKP